MRFAIASIEHKGLWTGKKFDTHAGRYKLYQWSDVEAEAVRAAVMTGPERFRFIAEPHVENFRLWLVARAGKSTEGVESVKRLILERASRRRTEPAMSRNEYRKFLTDRMQARIKRAIMSMGLPYRTSKSRWAGGDHTTEVVLSDTGRSCSGGSTKRWSHNGKWSGNDSTWSFVLPYYWYTRIYLSGKALTDDGLLVLDINEKGERLVAVQSRGFALRAEWRRA